MTKRTHGTGILAVAALIGALSMFGTNASSQQAAASAPQAKTQAKVREGTDAEFMQASKAQLAKVRGTARPAVQNPKSTRGGISPSMHAVLEAQMQTASAEHSQALAAMHAQPAGTTPAAGAATVPPKTTAATRTATPTVVGPEKTMSATTTVAGTPPTSVNPSHPPARGAAAPAPLTAMACRAAGINTVNGKTKGTVFTPVQDYNLYTIKGCMFGNEPGEAYIFGPFKAQRLNLQPNFWTDNEIDVRLDPNVAGEIDQNNNVTLVVVPKAGPEIKATGFSFYAARVTVLLSAIPQSWVKLYDVVVGFKHATLDYSSPISQGSPGAGATSYVYRYLPEKFNPQFDYYDFSQLPPGWTTESAQLFTYDSNECSGIVTYKASFGSWQINWDNAHPDNILVYFVPTACSGIWPPPPLPPVWSYSNRTVSTYAVKVWVSGPRGTTP